MSWHSVITRLGKNPRVTEAVLSMPGMEETVDRFIAGEHPATALVVALDFADKGLDISFAHTAPEAPHEAAARANAQVCDEMIRLAGASPLAGHEISISLQQLGMHLGSDGPALATELVTSLVERADSTSALVTLEMGPPDAIDDVLAVAEKLYADHPHLGITVQANLRRTTEDLSTLIAPGRRIRLCKGRFRVNNGDGFDTSHQIDRHYVRLLRALMESTATPLVATHDARMVSITHELVRRNGRTRDDYEFHMLHGVRPLEHRRLVDTGRRLRVYLPFGQAWYPYIVRRIAEKPQMLTRLARQMINRR